MKLELKRCPLCGSPAIRRQRVDRVYRVPGGVRRVGGVAVQACTRCGESFLDAAALAYIDRALGLKRRRRKRAHAA
jgi:YgiT-type zinc finger domain-containing protein